MKSFPRMTIVCILTVFMSLSAPVWADDTSMTEGVIIKINKDTGMVTIKHGEIVNLDMPPMTMVFGLQNPAMLEALNKGDAVMFDAIDDGGKLMITEIMAAH